MAKDKEHWSYSCQMLSSSLSAFTLPPREGLERFILHVDPNYYAS